MNAWRKDDVSLCAGEYVQLCCLGSTPRQFTSKDVVVSPAGDDGRRGRKVERIDLRLAFWAVYVYASPPVQDSPNVGVRVLFQRPFDEVEVGRGAVRAARKELADRMFTGVRTTLVAARASASFIDAVSHHEFEALSYVC